MIMKAKLLQFLRDKFDILLIAALFVFVFLTWIGGPPDRAGDVKELAQGLLYALLALLGIRPRSGPPAIDTATTESGDIITNVPAAAAVIPPPADPANIAPPADPAKETKINAQTPLD